MQKFYYEVTHADEQCQQAPRAVPAA
jgi:hypothetical protein